MPTKIPKIDDTQRMNLDDSSDHYIRWITERSLRMRVARDLFVLEIRVMRLLDLMDPCPDPLRVQLRHLAQVADSTAEGIARSLLDEDR